MTTITPKTLLGSILRTCATEVGGVRPLARAIGVSHESVYAVIRGTRTPSRLVARAIADYLAGRDHEADGVTAETVREWSCESVDVSTT